MLDFIISSHSSTPSTCPVLTRKFQFSVYWKKKLALNTIRDLNISVQSMLRLDLFKWSLFLGILWNFWSFLCSSSCAHQQLLCKWYCLVASGLKWREAIKLFAWWCHYHQPCDFSYRVILWLRAQSHFHSTFTFNFWQK